MNSRSRTISTHDGREICLVEAGHLEGTPVLVHHGTPGSRILYRGWIEDAEARGIHLISYDRPGYGGSTPQPNRNFASAAEDVRAIAEALNIKRLLVWGSSGGGPHALACAALLPELVVAAASLASPAPYEADGLDWYAGMGEDNVKEFAVALKGREALQELVERESKVMMEADPAALVEALRSILCPADVAVFTGERADYLLTRIREGIKDRGDGWIDDDLAFMAPWGFELGEIQIPVLLIHGEQDQVVPYSHGKWLAGKIPGVEARFLRDDGHLTVSAHRIPEVHAWLLSKL